MTARYDVEFRRRLLAYYVGGLTPESVSFPELVPGFGYSVSRAARE